MAALGVEHGALAELQVRELRRLDEVEALAGEWDALVEACAGATPFQTFEWCFGLLRFAGGRAAPRVLAFRDGEGRLLGLAPLCVSSRSGLPILELVGTGPSDYLDLLAREGERERVLAAFLRWLDAGSGWRVADLVCLREDTARALERGGGFAVRPFAVASHALLPDSLEAYEKEVLSKNARKGMRRRLNLLEREGRRVEFSSPATAEELERDLAALYALHQARQRAKGERGRFFDPRWCESFGAMAAALFARGRFRLGVMRIDGRPAASLSNLRLHDREYGYLGGMEPELSQYAPATLLEHWMVGEAIRSGTRVYDMARGAESYKERWTTDSVELYEAVRGRTSADALLWQGLESARRRLVRSRLLKRAWLATLGRLRGAG